MITNLDKNEILDRLYEKLNGQQLASLMDAIDWVLTGSQKEKLYNGEPITIDPSTSSGLRVVANNVARLLGYDPEDERVYQFIIDPLVKPPGRCRDK